MRFKIYFIFSRSSGCALVNSNRYQRNLQYRSTVQNICMATIAFKEFSLLLLLWTPESPETVNSIFFSRLRSQYFFWYCNFHQLHLVFYSPQKNIPNLNADNKNDTLDQSFPNAVPRHGTMSRGLPYRAAKRQCCTTVNIKRKLIFGVAEQRSAGQRWADYHILRSTSSPDLSELSPSPTTVQKIFKSKWIQKIGKMHNKNAPFLFH